MSWTAEAQKRAVASVISGRREFALVLSDGTEYADGPRVSGMLSGPIEQDGAYRAFNVDVLEFPAFARTETRDVAAIAVYDGPVRLVVVPVGRVAMTERVQVVLRPKDLWVGVSQ